MLASLLQQNERGQLRPMPGCRGGFVDARGKKQVKLCGIGRFLHYRTSAFPKLSKKAYRARMEKKIKKKTTKKKASSKRIGQYFHRQVHHALICAMSEGEKCTCPEGKTTSLARQDSPAYGMVLSAVKALRFMKVVPICGERIIAAEPEHRLGTRFDLLAADALDPSKYVLVSWKTTGTCPFSSSETFVSADRVMETRRETDSSETIVAREHIAQLVCELHMLRDIHRLGASLCAAAIVYLFPGDGDRYQIVWLSSESVKGEGYARAWEWIVSKKKQ